jgi:hypothetical protein
MTTNNSLVADNPTETSVPVFIPGVNFYNSTRPIPRYVDAFVTTDFDALLREAQVETIEVKPRPANYKLNRPVHSPLGRTLLPSIHGYNPRVGQR